MQGLVSDKTFHLKWNNHLQNLSQLFTTIYSSSALADVTLSCRDGTLKAHKLVLSACSPYFEQIFRDNPCQHPIVILKGIPFSEINLLVEFMYKGSVDVQELDLQSLMHTASELEIRGLAYEARDNAAQLLNVNLEYPTYTQTQVSQSQTQAFPQARTDVERLKQIHMYQQSMMRAEEIRRRRRDDTPGTHTAVNNILAAAAREMEEARHASRGERVVASIQTEHDQAAATSTPELKMDEDRPKKRTSILTPDDDKLRAKKKMTVRFQDDKMDERPNKVHSPGAANEYKGDGEPKPGGIKVVQLSALQKPANNDHDDSDEKAKQMEDDEETDSSGSMSDAAANDCEEGRRPHVCDVCDLRFQRSSHLSRHRLTHTGERPFTCGGCGRSFARSDKLRVHTKICERAEILEEQNVPESVIITEIQVMPSTSAVSAPSSPTPIQLTMSSASVSQSNSYTEPILITVPANPSPPTVSATSFHGASDVTSNRQRQDYVLVGSNVLVQIQDDQKQMSKQLAVLQASVDLILQKITKTAPDHVITHNPVSETPFTFKAANSHQELEELEEKLKNETFLLQAVDSMTFICGSSGKMNGIASCYKLIDYFITRELLVKCSWTGTSRQGDEQGKIPIKYFNNIRKCFLTLVRRSDNDFSELNCDKFLKTIIKNAKQRLNPRIMSTTRLRPRKVKAPKQREALEPEQELPDSDDNQTQQQPDDQTQQQPDHQAEQVDKEGEGLDGKGDGQSQDD